MTVWRKSSYSGGGGATDCVELGNLAEVGIGIRDSKNPEAGHLTVARIKLADLVRQIKDGDLDLPA